MSANLVVVGLGYVGLPLVRAALRAGLRVTGIDLDIVKIQQLRQGDSYVDDVSSADVKEMLTLGFVPTSEPDCIADAATVVLCVPTPLDSHGMPDLAAVKAAGEMVGQKVQPDQLFVLESTTYPGTTEEVLRPLLERGGLVAGRDFHLAYSPERIDPGNPDYGLENVPKIVGGLTPACTEAAAAFYRKFVNEVVTAKGPREAELAKLLENTYRHVNIALMNEMKIFCNELGLDLWEAIRLASTKPFGYQPFFPGPGVGGHCIPIDPSYLSYKVRTVGYQFRFVELAQEINNRMPTYVVTRVQRLLNAHGKPVNSSSILLLGVTYKANTADDRESPARPLAQQLLDLGAQLSFHDPYVREFDVNGHVLRAVEDLMLTVTQADLVIVLQPHAAYDLDALCRHARLVFDTRCSVHGPNVETL